MASASQPSRRSSRHGNPAVSRFFRCCLNHSSPCPNRVATCAGLLKIRGDGIKAGLGRDMSVSATPQPQYADFRLYPLRATNFGRSAHRPRPPCPGSTCRSRNALGRKRESPGRNAGGIRRSHTPGRWRRASRARTSRHNRKGRGFGWFRSSSLSSTYLCQKGSITRRPTGDRAALQIQPRSYARRRRILSRLPIRPCRPRQTGARTRGLARYPLSLIHI